MTRKYDTNSEEPVKIKGLEHFSKSSSPVASTKKSSFVRMGIFFLTTFSLFLIIKK